MGACLLAALVIATLVGGCGAASAPSDSVPPGTATATAAGETRPATTAKPVKGSLPGVKVRVAEVTDGDTIVLANGRRVRLVQIDAPESREDECYGAESAAELESLLPPGTQARLVADPGLDRVDDYGRLLRYVYRGDRNLNVVLVRRGAATVWFYGGDRGVYAKQLLRAAREARAASRGLWGACPGTPFDPAHGASTGSHGSSPATGGALSCPGAVPWNEAAAHAGERTTVEGPVAGTHFAVDSNRQPTFLNVGVDHPDERRFTVVIWGDRRAAFPGPPEAVYAGRTICVTGTVELYHGLPEIEVSSPEQIEIVEQSG